MLEIRVKCPHCKKEQNATTIFRIRCQRCKRTYEVYPLDSHGRLTKSRVIKIVKGTEKGSWKPHWLNLFQLLKDVVPPDWQIIVSADRGLYADWIFEAICSLNWHPFLRINHQGTYQIKGEEEWQSLGSVVPTS